MRLSQSSAQLTGRAVPSTQFPTSPSCSRALYARPNRQLLGSRFELLMFHGFQQARKTLRSASLPSRASRYGRPGIMSDAEACSHSSVVKVAIFTAAQTAESTKFRVQLSAETKTCTVDRLPFFRVALSPSEYRGTLLGNSDPPRPQIHTGSMSFQLDRQPVPRHARICIGGREPDLARSPYPASMPEERGPLSRGPPRHSCILGELPAHRPGRPSDAR